MTLISAATTRDTTQTRDTDIYTREFETRIGVSP